MISRGEYPTHLSVLLFREHLRGLSTRANECAARFLSVQRHVQSCSRTLLLFVTRNARVSPCRPSLRRLSCCLGIYQPHRVCCCPSWSSMPYLKLFVSSDLVVSGDLLGARDSAHRQVRAGPDPKLKRAAGGGTDDY